MSTTRGVFKLEKDVLSELKSIFIKEMGATHIIPKFITLNSKLYQITIARVSIDNLMEMAVSATTIEKGLMYAGTMGYFIVKHSIVKRNDTNNR